MDITRRRNLTATIPSPLLNNLNRVEDLGCFDEEECRFFLREVGERVVPVYPFSFGMEEVYSLILERYGYAGLPDATSVLQDLLENERTAAGFGDDGDVWRSWRHSWRHRNDDALNPFIPRVGSFILQQPTQPHIRKLKAMNFIIKTEKAQRRERARQAEDAGKRKALIDISPNQNRTTGSPPGDIHTKPRESDEENAYRLPATTYSHQRTRALLASEHGSSPPSNQGKAKRPSTVRESDATQISASASSQQEFIEVEPSLLDADIDPALLVSFEMLSSRRSSSGPRPTLRGGQGEILTLQQIGPSQNSPSSKDLNGAYPPSHMLSSATYVGSCEIPWSQGKSHPSSPMTSGKTEPLKDSTKVDRQEPAEHDKSAEKHRKLSDSLKHFARRPIGDSSDFGKRTCAVNRQARVFDGTIWHPKVRKRQSSQVNLPADEEAVVEERRRSVVRRSLTPVWQRRDSSRNSWMEIMRNFFRTESGSSQAKQSKAEDSNQIQNAVPDSATSSNTQTVINTQSPVEQERKPYPLWLDGTIDPRPFVRRSRSIMDFNKPLPLSPGEIVRSLSTHTQLPRSHQPQLVTLNNTAHSPDLEYDSHALTSQRIKRKEVPTKHQLSPVREVKDASAAHAADPQKAGQPPLSAITYSSIANMNPFQDNPTPEVPVFLPAVSAPEGLFAVRGKMPEYLRGMPHTAPEHIALSIRQWVPNFCLPPPRPEHPERRASKSRIFTSIKNLVNKRNDSQDVNCDTPTRGPTPEKKTRKNSLQKLGSFLKHPFMSQAPTEVEKVDSWMKKHVEATAPRTLVSLDPATQARILGDVELILVTATNNFLVHEANAARLNPEIVMRFSHDWRAHGLRPVVEFLYDCRTQYHLVLANMHTVEFSTTCSQSVHLRDSCMQVWSTIVDDVSVHAFCLPDDIVVKHLYALPQVLRMLRAPQSAHLAVRGLQLKTSAKIAERKALGRARKAARGPFAVRVPQYGDGLFHRRDISVDSEEDVFGGLEAVVANMPAPASLAAALDGPGPTVRKDDRVGVL